MAICKYCGAEFDVSYARHVVGCRYGAGSYDEESPNADICDICASESIGTAMREGAEIIKLMGSGYDDD